MAWCCCACAGLCVVLCWGFAACVCDANLEVSTQPDNRHSFLVSSGKGIPLWFGKLGMVAPLLAFYLLATANHHFSLAFCPLARFKMAVARSFTFGLFLMPLLTAFFCRTACFNLSPKPWDTGVFSDAARNDSALARTHSTASLIGIPKAMPIGVLGKWSFVIIFWILWMAGRARRVLPRSSARVACIR